MQGVNPDEFFLPAFSARASSRLIRIGGVEMRRKRLRRLEVLLPDDHFIWSFEPGCRGPLVRAYLDLLPVLQAQAELLERVLARLGAIEERLARLEAGGVRIAGQGPQGDSGAFDAAGFFAAFDASGGERE